MFGFLLSQAARARRDASNWIEVADKVIHYRCDQLAEADLRDLQQRRDELKAAVKAKADAARIKLGIGALEPVLHRCGGSVYPKTVTADNVEFFLAAAIVILGVKAFFLQPFKIPTNSMWPTYHGMVGEVWQNPADAPGVAARAGRFAAFLAVRYEVRAPVDGEVVMSFALASGDVPYFPFRLTDGRKWLVIPTKLREYEISVGGRRTSFTVPGDFAFEKMMFEAYFDPVNPGRALAELERKGMLRRRGSAVFDLILRPAVRREEVAFSFDILGGDQLVVDRVSNHFFPPKVGEGFVFRTGGIEGLKEYGDQYYVKRLVGLPGDELEIRDSVLFRNGKPITGAAAFEMNATHFGRYRGYAARDALAPGKIVPVPKDGFYAMGDNSYDSLDSRRWGRVPRENAVGRPLFIYYPLTSRWGMAR